MKLVRFISIALLGVSSCVYAACNARDVHQYMWANYHQFGGNQQETARWYNRVLTHDVPIYAYKGYLVFLYDMGNFSKIIELMPTIEASFKKDSDIQLLFARALDRVGQKNKSDERIIQLAHEFKTHQEIIFQAAQVYVAKKEPENAIKAIDSLLNISPRRNNNFIFYFLKSQIYVQLNKPEEALKNVKLCLDMHPGFSKGWLLLALLEEQRGRLDEAIKGYTTFIEVGGRGNTAIEQHLLQLIFRQRIEQRQMAAATMNKSCFDKALYYFEATKYNQALEHVDMCLKEKPTDEQARLLKIQILSALDKQIEAADLLKTWIIKDPENDLWLRTLHLLCAGGLTYQKAVATLEDVCKECPKALLPLLYHIDLSMRARNLGSMIPYYKQALALTTDTALKTKLLFHMGLVYYEQQKYDDMRDVLEQGYNLGQNFAPLLNLLAYYYATASRDLKRAQELIHVALAKDTNNPHYLDTQALIYYKQHKYDKALSVLQVVAKKVPNNFDVLKHLGKTYYKLGDTQQAITTIKQAHVIAQHDYEKNKCTNLLNQWQSKH